MWYLYLNLLYPFRICNFFQWHVHPVSKTALLQIRSYENRRKDFLDVCWNTFCTLQLTQPSRPHWCSNFTQKYNNGTQPGPSLHCLLYKVPSGQRVQVQTSQLCPAFAALLRARSIWDCDAERSHFVGSTMDESLNL